jgi:hypothetical protein
MHHSATFCGALGGAFVLSAFTQTLGAQPQSQMHWAATLGPVIVLPHSPTRDGGVLGLSGRVSRLWHSAGPFTATLDVRGHVGKAAGNGDVVCVSFDPCNPVTGQIPWTVSVGPSVAYGIRRGANEWTVRGFAGPALGGLKYLQNQGADGVFTAAHAAIAIELRRGSGLIEFEEGRLSTVRQMRPTLWTLRFGRTW